MILNAKIISPRPSFRPRWAKNSLATRSTPGSADGVSGFLLALVVSASFAPLRFIGRSVPVPIPLRQLAPLWLGLILAIGSPAPAAEVAGTNAARSFPSLAEVISSWKDKPVIAIEQAPER